MNDKSILTSIKTALGFTEDYDVYDDELTMHINAALATLTQLGIGPKFGFLLINNQQTWSEFMGDDPRLAGAYTVVYLNVKLIFDPPSDSGVLGALQAVRDEAVFRVNLQYEEAKSNPDETYNPVSQPVAQIVLDEGQIT